MSVTRRVKVIGVPKKCAKCGKDIDGTAIKHKEKGRKAVYYHIEGCFNK